jgi:hypothetical protein
MSNIIGPSTQGWDRSGMRVKKEKCLVVHSHPTPIPPLCTWTNNVVKKVGSHYTLSTMSNIIGPSTQGWDRSGMRVYNQAFLFFLRDNCTIGL